MEEYTETSWAVRKKRYGGISITLPKAKKVAYDLGLKTAGVVLTYLLGKLIGEAFEYVPYVKEAATHVVEAISGIDIKGDLGSLTALLFGAMGFVKSGVKLDNETLECEDITLSPLIKINKWR